MLPCAFFSRLYLSLSLSLSLSLFLSQTNTQHLHGVSGVDLINLVLENFAVLQVIRNASTGEVLFSSACLFEAVPPGADTGVHVYKLLDMREELSLRRNTA